MSVSKTKTKKFKSVDWVRGRKTRTFHSGERVKYLDWWGTVTETGTVRLDDGSELVSVITDQCHKLKPVSEWTGQEIKTMFDWLSPAQQWLWILLNKKLIDEVILDNDNCSVHLKGDPEALYVLYPKHDLGNRSGVKMLLTALGINANFC